MPVSAGEQEDQVGCACVWTGTWTLLPHPTPTPAVTDQPRGLVCLCVHRNMNVITPPHPTGNWSAKSSACVCRTARKMIRLLCLSVHRNMNVITPPHPIPRKVPVSAGEKKDYKVCCVCVCTGTWTLLATPPHPTPSPDSPVCTDEPDMCAQMNPKCVYRWPWFVCAGDPPSG